MNFKRFEQEEEGVPPPMAQFEPWEGRNENMQQDVIILQQPLSFRIGNLDIPSQVVYQSLNTKHVSGEELKGKVDSAGSMLMSRVHGRFGSLKGNADYNSFLSGLTLEDETIVSEEPHLQYRSMVFSDEFGKILHTRVGGRAVLTNKRMLLLSSEYCQPSSLNEIGDAKTLPGGYKMEMSCKDSTYYQPIPLSCFRSVELEGSTGVSGSISILGQEPVGKGLLQCCGFLKTWNTQPMVYNEFNEMKLTFGVLMPPWDHKRFVTLHLQQNVPMHYLKGFVAQFQTVTYRINAR